MKPPEYDKAVALASDALLAAIAQEWDDASLALTYINDECGPTGLVIAMIGWCDTLVAYAIGEIPNYDLDVRLTPIDLSGAANAEDSRWVTELIQARARRDIDAFKTLIEQLNAVPTSQQRGAYVSHLLESVALTMRTMPHGYAN